MKKLLLIVIVALSIAEISFAQVKIILATQQKTFGGMGGVFMNYAIRFKTKKDAVVEIDSVKTISDNKEIKFTFYKNDAGYYEMTNSQSLKSPEKCKTCPDATPTPSDLTKGIVVYYKSGGKSHSFKVKKFKQLEDLRLP